MAIISFLLLAATPLIAQDEADENPLTHEAIQGAWELKSEDGSKRIKFIAGGQWTITQYDPSTGTVVFHHGGTYTLDGATYTETVIFANESTIEMKGDSNQFEITVDGDVLRQRGIGNPWNEDWTRIKPQ